jgi:hypothetical protein
MTMAQSDEQTNVRIPKELKDWLKQEADKARRSFTSEIVMRLEQSKDLQQKGKK